MNIDELIRDTGDFLCREFSADVEDVAEGVHKALGASKESIAQLITARANGELTEDEFNAELQRESLVFETELLTLKVIAKATITKICQAAISYILKSANSIS
ncbi:hypothetical protein [Pseudoalteromonas luteoviolacea]|uniref:Uncharacterized protein n=1 Tax=Pseudoalteromonas luteoviolacea S4054 TaxID=1129367 RepID=A0A0F6AEK1_9GAMM|nr:hypothetical protein [Pseudoalteromonas luteoviolacea]AOT08305.1 hypothetical protein S4054249_10815 [Pseudoalteromonas luteoviolacea]AOT13221.1 hypothetical protein S40542_10790 [Pseudoalteromonas luteoviolacea]AOT18134.1 hypothetical protein S4054_10790 [Pseudoalteromonas luteoviolacea]KKE84241.1 hypothetical protein N479_10100 [Pseudoalteromonas luteoviolacea S4054]KZN76154.1 hypothetical protein N481_07315 [Pseudoalteromonas luteoviolacea S4047-1]